MDITFRVAGREDAPLLSEMRERALCSAYGVPEDLKNFAPYENILRFYQENADSQSLYSLIAYVDGEVASCGSICFYTVMPGCSNPSGENAYIMNMYTYPKFRGKGIAKALLLRLTQEARSRGLSQVTLEATKMGRPLYEKLGFVDMPDEMQLPFEGGAKAVRQRVEEMRKKELIPQ